MKAAACFSRDGCFITPDSTAVRGREQIGPVIMQLTSICQIVAVDQRTMLTAGHAALGTERWTMRFASDTADAFVRTSRSTMVLARPEGCWRLAVAALWRFGQ